MIEAVDQLRVWLTLHGIVPEDVTITLRAKTPQAELAIAQGLADDFLQTVHGAEQMSYPTGRAYHVKLNGMHVVIAALDTSARVVERK